MTRRRAEWWLLGLTFLLSLTNNSQAATFTAVATILVVLGDTTLLGDTVMWHPFRRTRLTRTYRGRTRDDAIKAWIADALVLERDGWTAADEKHGGLITHHVTVTYRR